MIGNYRSVVFEGGDQVGKGDASLNFSRNISEKVPVTQIAFPTYSLPIGACVRYMLKNGLDNICKKISPEEEFEARMAMYALNRLEVTNSLLNDRYRDRFLIFDRSPYSNALTIAYGLGSRGDIKEEDLERYVKKGLEYEQFIIKTLGLDNCVIELFDDSKEEWSGSRSEGDDQYESSSVQSVCGEVYNVYAEITGNGWKKIPTKNEDGWRDRGYILENCLNFVFSKYPNLKDIDSEDTEIEFLELREDLRALYKESVVPSYLDEKLSSAIKGNDKRAMYDVSLEIAKNIVNTCEDIVWVNEDIKSAFKEIINQCPFCLEIINHFMGEKYVKLLVKSYE